MIPCPLSRLGAEKPRLWELDEFEWAQVEQARKAVTKMDPPPTYTSETSPCRRARLGCASRVVTLSWPTANGHTVRMVFEGWTIPERFTRTGRDRARTGLYRIEIADADGNVLEVAYADWGGWPMRAEQAVQAMRWALERATEVTDDPR
jgi:hypothetical protein